MNERIKQSKTPIPESSIFDRRVINPDDPEIKAALDLIKTLPPKIQGDIYADIEKQMNLGISAEKAVERFKILVAEGKKLIDLSVSGSKPRSIKSELQEFEPKTIREIAETEFDNIDGKNSDKTYTPKPTSIEEKKEKERDEMNSKIIENDIRQADIADRVDRFKPKGTDSYKN